MFSSQSNGAKEASVDVRPGFAETARKESGTMAVLDEGVWGSGVARAIADAPLQGFELGQALAVLRSDKFDFMLGARADAQNLDRDVETVMIEDAVENPGPLENHDWNAVFLLQRTTSCAGRRTIHDFWD